MHRLPPIPDGLTALDPLYVGAAARLGVVDVGLRQRPVLWVQAPRADLLARPDATSAPDGEHLHIGDWRVRAVSGDYADALRARPVGLDAVGRRPGGEWIDPVDGLADLRAGQLRVQGDLTQRPADLVNALALASALALTPPPELLAQIADSAGAVLKADRHRLRDALTRLLVGQRPSEALEWLARTGLLPLVLPEAAAMIDFHRSSRHHHKDVWDHTRQVVRQAVPRPTVRWAALLHDIAKVHTRSYGPKRTVRFLLHDELGAQMTEGVMARLRFPPAAAARIETLVRLHLRANYYVPEWTDAAVRRFMTEAGEALEESLLLSRADITSKRPGKRRSALHTLNALQARIEAVRAADALRRPRVPKGLGKLIITELGVTPGPRVGELRAACDAAARDGRLPPAPSMAECLAFLRAT